MDGDFSGLKDHTKNHPDYEYRVFDVDNQQVATWKAGEKIFDIRDEIIERDPDEDLIGKEIPFEDVKPGDKIKVFSNWNGVKQENFISKVNSIEKNMINATVLPGGKNISSKPDSVHGYDRANWIFELMERD